ncbi:hypothetical protein, partial [Pseudomonas syringae]|uniref:hypothetical protein n=1 Tax=Pseudomonas syringae TaxID=317 RepID=UPI001C5582F4
MKELSVPRVGTVGYFCSASLTDFPVPLLPGPQSGKGTEKSLSIHFSAWVMGEKSFLPTSTPRWHHA